MKPSFEKQLNSYNQTVRESGHDLSPEGKATSLQHKTTLLDSIAQQEGTTRETEDTIYALQKSKLEKLRKFKKFLERTRTTDGGFTHPEMQTSNNATVSFANDTYYITTHTGERSPADLTTIMTDSEWDVSYQFDTSVPIHTVRTYYLEQLKSDLRNKLDRQIIARESTSSETHVFKQEAYKKIGERMDTHNEQAGVIAEKMVKNFLKKLSFAPYAGFEIRDADAYQDVEQKIDFVIHKTSGAPYRGARIEESETRTDIGIQFTTALDKVAHKQGQIDRVKKHGAFALDDIVLVALPVAKASDLYRTWAHQPTSGGPESLWDMSTQETLFRGVMRTILSEQEIDNFCATHFASRGT
jgi:hypothetical protein